MYVVKYQGISKEHYQSETSLGTSNQKNAKRFHTKKSAERCASEENRKHPAFPHRVVKLVPKKPTQTQGERLRAAFISETKKSANDPIENMHVAFLERRTWTECNQAFWETLAEACK